MATGVLNSSNTEIKCLRNNDLDEIINLTNKEEQIKRFYYSDNLDALNNLSLDDNVVGKVELIYIDPPYNTGFTYQTRDLVNAYNDKFSIEDYVAFMKKRLILLYKLLSPSGSIYVQLDSNMLFHIKILMDEIFGTNHFKGLITRKKCKNKNNTTKNYGNISDYILFYTKSNSSTWHRPYAPWPEDKITKEYPFIEKNTGRRYKRVPIHAPGIRKGCTGGEWHGMLPPKGKHWQYKPETLEEMDARGEIYWSSNGNPRRKVYFDESKGIPVQDIWLDYLDIDNQNTLQTGYPTEKNIDMIKRIISASSNKGDIVLDCFAGSGTTMIAADELNRQWIGIDISEESLKTVLRRLFIGSKPLGDYKTHKKRNDPELFDYKQAFGVEQTYKITDFDIFSYKSQENFIRQLLNEYTRTNK